ncbi:hypothetical protein ACQ4M3_39410 [Leptolyngbya sp. AN03gr2]|uniref:hypothetical protein n=1 Tax=unclassified Leptolyngbya TaxID=2650499 RepID=UPI003D31A157
MNRIFVAMVTSAVILAGLSSSAVAQIPRRSLLNGINQGNQSNLPITDHESDPSVEERNLRNEFRGINLTPQQFEQLRKARRQLRADLKQIMSGNMGQLLMLFVLPKAQADQRSVEIFKNPMGNYASAISKTLTPEQFKIWQRNVEQGAKERG